MPGAAMDVRSVSTSCRTMNGQVCCVPKKAASSNDNQYSLQREVPPPHD